MVTWLAFSRLSHKQVSPEQMNRLLEKMELMRKEFLYREPLKGEKFRNKCFIKWTECQLYLAYGIAGSGFVYWCYLDGRGFDLGTLEGKRAYAIMAKYYKPPRFDRKLCAKCDLNGKPNFGYLSSGPLLYSNPEFDGKRVEAYCYDINSAYGWALEQDIPDTTRLERNRVLKDNEIGFIEDGASGMIGWGIRLRMVHDGYANYCFPLMPSPYRGFVDKWFRKKRNSRSSTERKYAKMVVNEAIGYLQLINPFIRATIVERCNERVRSLMDRNTIYCNTDSICSSVPRDFKIGRELGQFKLEHQGKVALSGFTYQWDYEFPAYRAVPKSRFEKWNATHERKWDLLVDPIPPSGNDYEYSIIKRRLVKCEGQSSLHKEAGSQSSEQGAKAITSLLSQLIERVKAIPIMLEGHSR